MKTFRSHRSANISAAVSDQDIHRLGRAFLGRHDEVALVFAILIVDDDHDLPLANILYGIFYGAERLVGFTIYDFRFSIYEFAIIDPAIMSGRLIMFRSPLPSTVLRSGRLDASRASLVVQGIVRAYRFLDLPNRLVYDGLDSC